jgi:hypothetical protein
MGCRVQLNRVTATMTAIAGFALLAAACAGANASPEATGQVTSSPSVTILPVPSASPGPVPSPTAQPVPSGSARPTPGADWPAGDPVPEALRGVWYEPSYPTKMTLEGNDYTFIQPARSAHGNVVVNGDEIDFFNGDQCGFPLPRGVGKYHWELVDESTIKFTGLNEDPCGRIDILSGVTWSRTPISPTQSP